MKIVSGSKIIKLDWLNADALLLTTREQVINYKKTNKIPDKILSINDWDMSNGKVVWANKGKIPYFFITIKKKTLSIMVHESVHLAEYILRYKGIKPKGDQLAYMVEYIFNQVRNHIKKGK